MVNCVPFLSNKAMWILYSSCLGRWHWRFLMGIAMFICFLFVMMDLITQLPGKSVLKLRWMDHTRWHWERNSSAIVRASPLSPVDVFRCSLNDSKKDIPETIPNLHRNFLMYKHCRNFPRLLAPTPCEDDLFLLLAIKSTATQVDRRTALRSTWGKKGYIQGRRVKLLFLVAKSQDRIQGYPLQQLLELESRQFGDILQWDFVDSFFNLTLKEVHFLSWFSEECQWAKFVFKGDDDVFVHTSNLVEFVKDHNPSEQLLAGDIIFSAHPIRNPKRKYFVPVEMYPGNQYPPYAGGGGYLMSRQTVLSLSVAALSTDLFPIDDVYVGMCLLKLNVTLTLHSGFKTFGFHQVMSHFNPCIYKEIMLVHKLNPTEMWTMWSLLQDPDLHCFKNV